MSSQIPREGVCPSTVARICLAAACLNFQIEASLVFGYDSDQEMTAREKAAGHAEFPGGGTPGSQGPREAPALPGGGGGEQWFLQEGAGGAGQQPRTGPLERFPWLRGRAALRGRDPDREPDRATSGCGLQVAGFACECRLAAQSWTVPGVGAPWRTVPVGSARP